MKAGRDLRLDGMRGIAALCVALSHVAAMQWTPGIDIGAPTFVQRTLWHMGAPAVDLFIVLSGYVVAGSLARRGTPYLDHLVSRLVRLYPMAWAGVMAGIALRALHLTPQIGASGLLSRMSGDLAAADMIGLTTMIAPIPRFDLVNPPLWTLMLEMQAAFVMPVLLWGARRNPLALAAAGVFLPTIAATALHTAYPLPICGFFLGAALAVAEERIPRAPHPTATLLFFLVALLCRLYLPVDDPLLRIPCAVAAAGVVLAVRQGAGSRILSSRLATRLGAVSYPFYLVHFPIMAASVMTLGRSIGIPAAAVLSLPASMAAALVLEMLLDAPALRLSRMLKGS